MTPLLRIRHLFEYVCLRVITTLLRVLPASCAYALGAALGGLWYRCSSRRGGVARANLLLTGVAGSPTEADRIARASFRHFIGHLMEMPKLPDVLTAENWREHVELECSPSAEELLLTKERPVLLVSGHLGCWEVAAYWVSLSRPVYALARPMDNPYVQAYIERHRFRANVMVLSKLRGITPEMIAAWERTKAGFAVLMDQHAGHSGLWMNVFGHPASVHKSPARLHFLTGFPMLIGCFVRVGPMRYRAIMDGPVEAVVTGDREHDTRVLVAELNSRLEVLIRRFPEQYLWMHRRWRTPPEGVTVSAS